MSRKMEMKYSTPAQKVVAGSAGAGGVGAPLAVLIIFFLEHFWMDIPGVVEAAIMALIVAGVGFGVGYWTPPHERDVIRVSH